MKVTFTHSHKLSSSTFNDLKGTDVYAQMIFNTVSYTIQGWTSQGRDEFNKEIGEWLEANCHEPYYYDSIHARIYFLSRSEREEFQVWGKLKLS